MTIDVYTSAGAKKGSKTLPKTLFGHAVNEGLMHQFLVLQQSNRRTSIAHVKTRGEIVGTTKKLFRQKGTGRARRGSASANVLRGGNKSFGPRNNSNYVKNMPRNMRRTALRSCLSAQAKNGVIFGLENYPDTVKTKDAHQLLAKLPLELGRKVLFVLPESHRGLTYSVRNIPGVKTVLANYLNPEDVLVAKHIVFVGDAIEKADAVFGSDVKNEEKKVKSEPKVEKATSSAKEKKEKKEPAPKKSTTKKATTKKSTTTKKASSSSATKK